MAQWNISKFFNSVLHIFGVRFLVARNVGVVRFLLAPFTLAHEHVVLPAWSAVLLGNIVRRVTDATGFYETSLEFRKIWMVCCHWDSSKTKQVHKIFESDISL